MIFQWESQSATAYLKQLFSDETIAKIKAVNSDFSYMNLLSIGNGAIRPAGESYRDKLANGEYKLYGNTALDEFMKPTLGYMVYQEQIIEFLNKFCGFTMGEADVVRRCVDENTEVLIVNGTTKKIKNLSVGDYVVSVNPNNEIVTQKVVNVFDNGYSNVLKISFGWMGKESIIVTPTHKILTNEGWIEAENINANHLICIPGKANHTIEFIRIDSIKWLSAKHHVYDIEVENTHNYIANGIVVHNCFAKKTGTQDVIPVIKNGGYLNEGHYIEGFIQTMQDEYGIRREEAENLIGDFLQVIIDASDYLFSKNHADPYSWIGYICGYLRYYYPLEFITSALNIFEDKEEKSLAIIDYAKRRGITISPIKFRHSVAQYNFDKETNQIFKGLASIKYLNSVIADEIYALKDNQYDTFIDLLMDLKTKTSLDSRQTEILIDLDFFSEFGETNSLIFQYKILNIFFDKTKRQFKKQFSKDKLEAMNIPLDYIRPFAGKETPKMFTQVDALQFLRFLSTKVKVKPRTLAEKVNAQQKRLGYIDVKDDRYKNHFVILEVDTRYSPKIKAYSLRSGEVLTYKINKRIYSRNKLTEGTIVLVNKKETKNRVRKTENGFEDVPGVFDVWWTSYQEVNNL